MQGKYLEADGPDPKVIYFLVNTVGKKKKKRGVGYISKENWVFSI